MEEKTNSCDVLITCGRYAHQMVCHLAENGINVWATDCIPSAVKYSKYIGGYFITPDYNTDEEGYITELVRKVGIIHPKVLMPVFDVKIIARHKSLFPKTTIIPIDDYEKINLLDNKIDFLKFAKTLDVPMPNFIKSIDKIDCYPVVIKFPYGRSGDGVKILRSPEDLNSVFHQLSNEEYYITEFIRGTDYCIDCVRWDGFFQSSVYRSIQSSDNPLGPSVCREIVENEAISNYARHILDELDYHGVCGFDFRIDEQGNVFLFEANPRYTGGLGTQMKSGFNIPYLLYMLAIGKKPSMCTISTGTKTKSFMSFLNIAYKKILSKSYTDYRVKDDINLKTDVFEDIRKDDIKPFIYQLCINKRRVITVLLYYLLRIRITI